MTLSGWTRLWIVAAGIAGLCGCDFVYHTSEVKAETVNEMSVACDRFMSQVRKNWEVTPSGDVERREWAAIDQMRHACLTLENDRISNL